MANNLIRRVAYKHLAASVDDDRRKLLYMSSGCTKMSESIDEMSDVLRHGAVSLTSKYDGVSLAAQKIELAASILRTSAKLLYKASEQE